MSKLAHVEHIRWADQDKVTVVAAQTNVRSRELFRVSAPFPCTWRVIAGAQAGAALNFNLSLRLVVQIGIGSFSTQAPFNIAFNSTFLFELPAQDLSGMIVVADTVQANDLFTLGAGVAPNVPWEGLRVIPAKGH